MIQSALPDATPEQPPIGDDAVDRAILDLLARMPLTWAPLDSDKLTAIEQSALMLLTAAGMVERRFSFRLGLVGNPSTVEATITATGEQGLLPAVEPVLKAAWQAFAGEYLKGKAGAPQDQPTMLCQRTGPEEARLTQDGQDARQDVGKGQVGRLLDFVRRRGPVFAGEVVPGYGRCEAVRTGVPPAAPLQVELTNSGAMAAMNQMFQQFMTMQAKASSSQTPDDLITTEIVLHEYHTSRATIRRKVKSGELHDYRPPNSPRNTEFLLSRAEVGRFFARKE